MAAPMPLVEPVTIAVRPASRAWPEAEEGEGAGEVMPFV